MFEVLPFELPSRYEKYLTIERLLNEAKKDQTAIEYLPDEPSTHVNKSWLLNVLNTLDCNLLPSLMKEVDAKSSHQKKSTKHHALEVDADMMARLS